MNDLEEGQNVFIDDFRTLKKRVNAQKEDVFKNAHLKTEQTGHRDSKDSDTINTQEMNNAFKSPGESSLKSMKSLVEF